MQYHNNILCVTGADLIAAIGKHSYDKAQQRNNINVLQRACYGKPALIEFDSLPERYKSMFADPRAEKGNAFKDMIEPDAKAIEYYSHYLLADGRQLETKHQKQYSADASVLNAIHKVLTNTQAAKKSLSGTLRNFWGKALEGVERVREDIGHNLPGSEPKLKVKYKEYVEKGYEALISKKFCNENSRKVSANIEKLLLSFYTMPNKPFGSDVYDMYMRFIGGGTEVVDGKTGEVFKPADFINNGKPLEISRSTVWNYLNQPDNRSLVDSKRNGQFQFNSMHRPHHHRTAPNYAFSKISMDDRDLPRLLKGGGRVKAYYAYDVASGCVIGRSYSRSKDEELFLECMRDMFRLIERESFGMPLEVEVENHLVSKFFDDLGEMFPFVRICNPGNSQEKHAEHLNRAKKYSTEKKMQNGIGRWWARSEAYRVDAPKLNDEFVELNYTYERLVADDIEAVKAFNNQLHPKQKKYPNKTRWQVLVDNMNPNAARVSKPVVYKAIGDLTTTSINRNQYVTVQYGKYQVPNPQIIEKLAPGNYNVEAYHMTDSEGAINEVYLYQNGKYLCKADKVALYNTAKAEWTETDSTAYTEQAMYVAQFDKRKKTQRKELIQAVLHQPADITAALAQPVVVVNTLVTTATNDIEELLNNYNANEYAARGIQTL